MTPAAVINRLLAVLLALALVLGGLLVAIEIVLAQLGQPPWLIPGQQWGSWLSDQSWNTPLIRAVLAATFLVGLLLLILALRRGRPRLLAVESTTPGVEIDVVRRGAERALVAASRRATGVRTATASISRRTATLTATTDTRATDQVERDTQEAVANCLADLGLNRLTPRVTVKGTNR